MRFYTMQPSVPLAAYVKTFWVLEHDVPAGEQYVYRSLADGLTEMVFHYKGVFKALTPGVPLVHSGSFVHGQSSVYKRFATTESFGIFGVYFYPFALPRLFGLPACAFSNQMPTLQETLGRKGLQLEQRMLAAKDNRERCNIITAFLEKQLLQHPLLHNAALQPIQHIVAAKGNISVRQLAQAFSLSTRQFERRFKEMAGFSPKLFSRIIRFQSALEQYGNRSKSLTEIAHEYGYYDQAHFIHDFQSFSGYNPHQYFYGSPEGAEYREL